MFLNVFASFASLVLLVQTPNNNNFRVIQRENKSSSVVINHNMTWRGSTVWFDYDNQETSHDFMQLDTSYDKLSIGDEFNLAWLTWTFDRPNNTTDFYFHFKSDNFVEERFNLRVLVDFKVWFETTEDYIYEKSFDIDYSLADYTQTYEYVEAEPVPNLTLQNAYSGLLTGHLTIMYVPLDSYQYNSFDNYNEGYDSGYSSGYDNGVVDGYSNGYSDGYNDALEADTTAVTIFNGILNIAFIPINFFLSIFNFEILGINLSAFVSAVLSVCLVVIVIRFVLQKNGGGGNE